MDIDETKVPGNGTPLRNNNPRDKRMINFYWKSPSRPDNAAGDYRNLRRDELSVLDGECIIINARYLVTGDCWCYAVEENIERARAIWGTCEGRNTRWSVIGIQRLLVAKLKSKIKNKSQAVLFTYVHTLDPHISPESKHHTFLHSNTH